MVQIWWSTEYFEQNHHKIDSPLKRRTLDNDNTFNPIEPCNEYLQKDDGIIDHEQTSSASQSKIESHWFYIDKDR